MAGKVTHRLVVAMSVFVVARRFDEFVSLRVSEREGAGHEDQTTERVSAHDVRRGEHALPVASDGVVVVAAGRTGVAPAARGSSTGRLVELGEEALAEPVLLPGVASVAGNMLKQPLVQAEILDDGAMTDGPAEAQALLGGDHLDLGACADHNSQGGAPPAHDGMERVPCVCERSRAAPGGDLCRGAGCPFEVRKLTNRVVADSSWRRYSRARALSSGFERSLSRAWSLRIRAAVRCRCCVLTAAVQLTKRGAIRCAGLCGRCRDLGPEAAGSFITFAWQHRI